MADLEYSCIRMVLMGVLMIIVKEMSFCLSNFFSLFRSSVVCILSRRLLFRKLNCEKPSLAESIPCPR